MKRICVFGCKHTTRFFVDSLRRSVDIAAVITISSDAANKAEVADFCDMEEYCRTNAITCQVVNKYTLNDPEDQEKIQQMNPDIGFVIGWQRLIPEQVLRSFPVGVYGMHGSSDGLPIGRGRSPMNWALIERRNHFHTNLFRYDAGVDSGDILDTFTFSIQPGDTAETMHYKNTLAMKHLVLRNLERLQKGAFELSKQPDLGATYYPKRGPDDSLIDWNEDIFYLEAFIRAVAKPFNGAFTFCNGSKVIINRAEVFETDIVDFGYRARENGCILEAFPNGKFIVKCHGGIMIVHDYETSCPIKQGMQLTSPIADIRQFPRNRYGYHDMEQTQ